MSIPVDVTELAEALAGFGDGYLLTSGADGRVKAVSVRPRWVAGTLVVDRPGRGSLANATVNPALSVLWPPLEAGGHSLIVDGEAELGSSVGPLVVRPTGAVLHRPVD